MKLAAVDMNLHVDCFPCFVKQANLALSAAGADEALWRGALMEALRDIGSAEFGRTPSHASTRMHRSIRRMLGRDPFDRLKRNYNDLALGLLPSLKERVRRSPEPLLTAARMAIAGNIIDFGIFRHVDVEASVERALTGPLGVDHSEGFMRAISAAGSILYLLDNSGEIVFDMLLIAELQKLGQEVTAVVRGGPVLNDATHEDSRHVGLPGLCSVVDNGSDAVGTVLEEASPEFLALYERPGTLIISKGQGNFETLLHEDRDIYFLFQAKCHVVASALGLEKCEMILMGSRG